MARMGPRDKPGDNEGEKRRACFTSRRARRKAQAMSQYLFDPPAVTAVPIEGQDAVFAVRRILCVGRNYAAHRREMGGDDRDPPFFFAKPADAIVPPGGAVPYPTVTGNLHHEVELVVALGKGGSNIAVADALGHVFGYAVGVDLTRRHLRTAA